MGGRYTDNIIQLRPKRPFVSAVAPQSLREAQLAKVADDFVFAMGQYTAACMMGSYERIAAALERLEAVAIVADLILRGTFEPPGEGA